MSKQKDHDEAEYETQRKVALVKGLVDGISSTRIQHGSWGDVLIRMSWRGGVLREVKVTEENIIRDLDDS